MLAHLLSQLGFALPCVASFECDLGEEEGEFELNLAGGEGGGGCCYSVGWALGTKWLIVITLLVTISDSVSEELTNSTAISST